MTVAGGPTQEEVCATGRQIGLPEWFCLEWFLEHTRPETRRPLAGMRDWALELRVWGLKQGAIVAPGAVAESSGAAARAPGGSAAAQRPTNPTALRIALEEALERVTARIQGSPANRESSNWDSIHTAEQAAKLAKWKREKKAIQAQLETLDSGLAGSGKEVEK